MSEKVRFISEYRSHRLVRSPAGQQILANGNVVDTTPEVVYEFVDGALDLAPGEGVLNDGWNPETARFELPQDAISWIRTTPEYAGNKVFEVTPMAPPTGEVLGKVALAAAAGDVEALKSLGDEEAETWNREDVLDVIAAAITRLTTEPAKAS